MLNIFINTWGNYNINGAEGGRWATLPMDANELNDLLANIAESLGDNDPEFAIHDYEWTGEIELREISEMESITDLNEELQALDSLSEWEQKIFAAAVEYWGYTYVSLDDLDEFQLYEDIENEYDLGYYWAIESGCYNLDKMGNLAHYIDYEAFGRDINIESDGGFTSYGWIERC